MQPPQMQPMQLPQSVMQPQQLPKSQRLLLMLPH
jgi:hypothetical protein